MNWRNIIKNKKIIKVVENYIDLIRKGSLIDKILIILGPFFFILQIIIILFVLILVIYTSNSLIKTFMSCILILMLILLRKSYKLIKQIKKEIGKFIDNTQVKKDLIFFFMLYTFMMLITINISLFVFFWLQYYLYSTVDPFDMNESLKWLINTLGWDKALAFEIRVALLIGTIILLFLWVKPNMGKVYYKKKEKRTEEEKNIDKYMIYYARQMPKFARQLLYYNNELSILMVVSIFINRTNIHWSISFLGLLLFLLFLFFKIYVAYYRTVFGKRLYNYIWFICYKPNPDPDLEKVKKYAYIYGNRAKKVIYQTGGITPRKQYLRNAGIAGFGVWSALVLGQWSWDMFYDSEKNMYPPKKMTRYIGEKIKKRTGYPKNDND